MMHQRVGKYEDYAACAEKKSDIFGDFFYVFLFSFDFFINISDSIS